MAPPVVMAAGPARAHERHRRAHDDADEEAEAASRSVQPVELRRKPQHVPPPLPAPSGCRRGSIGIVSTNPRRWPRRSAPRMENSAGRRRRSIAGATQSTQRDRADRSRDDERGQAAPRLVRIPRQPRRRRADVPGKRREAVAKRHHSPGGRDDVEPVRKQQNQHQDRERIEQDAGAATRAIGAADDCRRDASPARTR